MQQKKICQLLLQVGKVVFFFFIFAHYAVVSEEPHSTVQSETCIPFHYIQEMSPSRKTPCRGYTLSVIALTPAVHNESLKCERLKMQKDRRRPDTCHPFHPEVFAPHTHTQSSIIYPLPILLLCFAKIFPIISCLLLCLGELHGVWGSYESHPVSCSDPALCPPGVIPKVTRACHASPSSTWITLAWRANILQQCHRKKNNPAAPYTIMPNFNSSPTKPLAPEGTSLTVTYLK